MRLSKLEHTAVAALEDIKARDIKVLDVRKLTSLYDTMVLATAESARQTKALASNVQQKMKAAGARLVGVEGEQGGDWILVDFGDIVVHIMQPAVRQYYNLEELWAVAPAKRLAREASAKRPARVNGESRGARDSAARSAPTAARRGGVKAARPRSDEKTESDGARQRAPIRQATRPKQATSEAGAPPPPAPRSRRRATKTAGAAPPAEGVRRRRKPPSSDSSP